MQLARLVELLRGMLKNVERSLNTQNFKEAGDFLSGAMKVTLDVSKGIIKLEDAPKNILNSLTTTFIKLDEQIYKRNLESSKQLLLNLKNKLNETAMQRV